jgi:hypothetical protein
MFTLLFSLRDCLRSRAVLQAEILALRHQLLPGGHQGHRHADFSISNNAEIPGDATR